MPYGTIKVDTITFTDAGVDKSVAISGLVQNPTFTGNVTATGTISGLIVQAPTVTGTTANFASGVYTTQISGAIVKVPAGNAGAPSIQVGVGASVAPGLYSPGTDQLALNTGGAGRLFIASDGRVGVGAANVTGGINLEVIGSAPTLRVTGTSASNAKFELVSVGATLWSQICSGSDGSLSFNRDGTERMRLDSSGRLLLGQSTNPDGYYFIVNTGSGSNNNAVQLSNNANADLRINLTSGVSLINANTGILALGTSGTERLRIDSSGNVGIGTATTISGVKLNVDTGINCNGLNVSGTGGFFNSANKFGVDNNAGITRMYSSGPNTSTRGSYDFRATDSVGTLDESRMVIDSSGRVGIGTSSPVQKLDVAGVIRGGDASATSGALILEGLYSGSDVINTFGSQHSSAATVIGYGVRPRNGTTGYTSTTGISSLFRGALEVGGADVAVRVLYAGASTTPIGNVITMSEAMRIDNAGRVGIGTSSPGYKLEVFGTSNANEIRSSDGTTISQWYQDTGGISYFGTVSNHPLAFRTNSSERMRIDSSGNVGIGTGAPGAKLHVIGFEARIESPIANDGFLRFTNTSGSMSIGMSGAPTNALLIADRINSQVAYTYNGGASGSHVWATNNIERLRIDGSGRVGIGTSNPGARLDILGANPSLHVGDNTGGTPDYRGYSLDFSRSQQTGGIELSASSPSVFLDLYAGGSAANLGGWSGQIRFFTGGTDSYGTERLRIDSSGRLLVGTSTGRGIGSAVIWQSQLEGASGTGLFPGFSVTNNSNDTESAYFILGKSRGTAVGSNTIVQTGDVIGRILFAGADGTDLETRAASIEAIVDGTPGANDMPGRLVFSTTADGASSPTERMRINSTGATVISHANNTYQLYLNNTVASGYTDTIFRADFAGYAPNNTTARYFSFGDTVAIRAELRSDGGLANYQANNVNLSDINTKKNISPAADTWDCIKGWEIVNYRYKDQPDDADLNLGVIAQQVAESCPEVITIFQEAKEATEEKPAQEERLGVKEQQMYWMAIKALQEAQLRIETLEAKVAALEGN
jgi:hypothetical protein